MSGDDGLREAIALAIYTSDGALVANWARVRAAVRSDYRMNADAILALPELAALRAKADGYDRASELAERWMRLGGGKWAIELRRALRGVE